MKLRFVLPNWGKPKLKSGNPLAPSSIWQENSKAVDAIVAVLGVAIIALVTTNGVNQLANLNNDNTTLSGSVAAVLGQAPLIFGMFFLITFLKNHYRFGL